MRVQRILQATPTGTTPASIAESGLPTSVIYSLDLGITIPAFALTVYWLWNRRSWGYAFTAVLLVKIATLGGAVLVMIIYMTLDGQAGPLPQVLIFRTLMAISLGTDGSISTGN